MERRIASRAQVDVPICAFVDGFRHECRAVDLSPSGMVVEVSRGLGRRALPQVNPLEIYLGGDRPIRTRARSLDAPTQLAGRIFAASRGLLEHETDGTRYRLLGVGVSALDGENAAAEQKCR